MPRYELNDFELNKLFYEVENQEEINNYFVKMKIDNNDSGI
jgi:hypothetical protein